MAYMDQTKKSELAPAIKTVLKKYGMKGTIGIRNHMVLVVNISAGKLDIINNWFDNRIKHDYIDIQFLSDGTLVDKFGKELTPPDYIQVNEYHINSDYTGKVKDFLNELKLAMNVGNYDHSDIMTDHFDVNFYIDINIGKWDKPYKLITE